MNLGWMPSVCLMGRSEALLNRARYVYYLRSSFCPVLILHAVAREAKSRA
jgi:hypothetical protein